MTIDTVDISTYGFRLMKTLDLLSLPARKKILQKAGVDAKDLIYNEKEIGLNLFTKFQDKDVLKTTIESFTTEMKSKLKHDYVLSSHGISFTGVLAKGLSVEITGNIVVVSMLITIVE